MRKISIIFVALLAISLSIFSQKKIDNRIEQLKLIQTLSAINQNYVDTINEKQLIESTIVKVLGELDPHSVFIPKEEVDRMREPLQGSFDGIGVQFQMIRDTITVVQTITGTPAERVGVLPGDKIVYISDSLVAGVGIKNSEILKKLRGKRGTNVRVKIYRAANGKELLEFKIKRDKIPLHSVDAAYMLTDKVGFIKVNSFGIKTYDEFKEALDRLKAEGMKSLILSLQHNGGGFLNVAIKMVDEFLTKNELIVYTSGVHQPRRDSYATSGGEFENGKLVVLIDEFSASASEILSGAIQDWDRGVIVGRRSFGKGLVQSEMGLIDGSMIRLTIARYYTPTGRSIQKPYNKGVENYMKDLVDRYNHGELMHKDSTHFPDSLKYKTLKKQRIVYGGGGIMPDVFVPLDTIGNTSYYRNLVAKGVVNSVSVEYNNSNISTLKRLYPTFVEFNRAYKVPQSLIDNMIKEGKKEKVPFNEEEYKRSEKLIKLQLKALTARAIWGDNEYFKTMDTENEILQKGIEIITNNKLYNKILKQQE